MNFAGSTVLVTGAGGFIGSHLVERLVKQNVKVRALVHYDSRAGNGNLDLLPTAISENVEVIAGDVCDAHFMLRAVEDCACVFHLAALIGIPYSYRAPASYVATNISGTLNVLEAVRITGCPRMVHTSTSECYGTALYTPIDEKHPLQGQSPYSATKIGADQLADSYYRSFSVPVTTLRPFNTYGPRQSARAIIPTIVSQLLSPSAELRLGSLDPIRDLLYVADTARAFHLAAETDQAIGETVHVGTGVPVTIGDLANLLIELTGKQKPITQDPDRIRPAKSEVFTLLCDPAKAKDLLGWTAEYTLEQGLKEVIDFVASHMDHYRSGSYAV
jgi:NAD dependent epimerase/dehydratase